MPDKEKVIKGVHDARKYLEDREWVDKSVGVHIDALNDALALLKEQNGLMLALEQSNAANEYLNAEVERLTGLLKEQKAKEGHWEVLEYCANEGIYCSECHMKIFDRVTKPKDKLSRYCPHCGSKNEQFFRDGERKE